MPSTSEQLKERLMLEQEKIDEYSRLMKACEVAKQEAQKINTEISMLKKQGMEKLQERTRGQSRFMAGIDSVLREGSEWL